MTKVILIIYAPSKLLHLYDICFTYLRRYWIFIHTLINVALNGMFDPIKKTVSGLEQVGVIVNTIIQNNTTQMQFSI